ncbi:MAG: hypothetical protein ACYDDS_07225 [Candidatus Sulfotelmatobacter sp.]
MRKLASIMVLVSLAAAGAWAQAAGDRPATQTARQALIEMFFSKTSGTLIKHLPAATLNALVDSGALANLQQYSMLVSQVQTKGKLFETFDTGSLLLVAEDAQSGQKFEIKVDRDSQRGDADDIDVSFLTYKDNKPQQTPFLPRMTFGMKTELGVWKLNEIQVTVRVPLADPDFLRGMTQAIKARIGAAAAAPSLNQASMSMSGVGSDASVLAAMQSILKAENTYSGTYRATGYTCTLSDLDGFGGGTPNEHQAMLIPSGLAGGRKYGYVFTLSGCSGAPAGNFRLVAVPLLNSPGRRALCSDQSGAIRYSTDGNPATCMASGVPVE